MSDPGGELVDHVDADDRVIGVVTRAEMRARNLRHRAVYVAVVTSDDELVVHQRADWKDVYPSYWDVCFGGVLDAGEAWDDAAARELAEEAGIRADLVELGRSSWNDGHAALNGRIYLARHDGPFHYADGEVVAVARIPLAEAERWAAAHDVCPDSADLVLPLLRVL